MMVDLSSAFDTSKHDVLTQRHIGGEALRVYASRRTIIMFSVG